MIPGFLRDPAVKPEWGVGADREHPHNQACALWWLLDQGSGAVASDLLGSYPPTFTASPGWGPSLGGLEVVLNGSTQDLRHLAIPTLSGDCTIVACARSGSPASGQRIFDCAQAAAQGLNVRAQGSAPTSLWGMDNGGGVGTTVNSVRALNDKQPHVVAVVRRGTTAEFWVDGVLQGSSTCTVTTLTRLFLGSSQGTAGTWWNGGVLWARVYNRALSADLLADLALRPYDGVQQSLLRRFYSVGGGGTTPVSDGDTATGTDAGTVTAGLSGTDTATGTETVSLAVAVAAAEAASGLEAGTLAAALTGTESGVGLDAGTPAAALTGSDTGAGLDAGTLTALLAGLESATGLDAAAILAALTAPDTATGSDTVSLDTGAAPHSGTDTGTGSETGSVATTGTAGETGAGGETTGLGANLPGADSGTGLDVASVDQGALPHSGTDSGTAGESVSQAIIAQINDGALGSETASVTADTPGWFTTPFHFENPQVARLSFSEPYVLLS